MNNYKLQYWPGFFEPRQTTGNIINESGSWKADRESKHGLYRIHIHDTEYKYRDYRV